MISNKILTGLDEGKTVRQILEYDYEDEDDVDRGEPSLEEMAEVIDDLTSEYDSLTDKFKKYGENPDALKGSEGLSIDTELEKGYQYDFGPNKEQEWVFTVYDEDLDYKYEELEKLVDKYGDSLIGVQSPSKYQIYVGVCLDDLDLVPSDIGLDKLLDKYKNSSDLKALLDEIEKLPHVNEILCDWDSV